MFPVVSWLVHDVHNATSRGGESAILPLRAGALEGTAKGRVPFCWQAEGPRKGTVYAI